MGGSSKPEAPKVTPFVEPPAQRNPIPNFFQRGNPSMGGGQPAQQPRFQMNPAASQGAMRMPMQQQPQQGTPPGLMSPEIQALLALLAKQGRI